MSSSPPNIFPFHPICLLLPLARITGQQAEHFVRKQWWYTLVFILEYTNGKVIVCITRYQ